MTSSVMVTTLSAGLRSARGPRRRLLPLTFFSALRSLSIPHSLADRATLPSCFLFYWGPPGMRLGSCANWMARRPARFDQVLPGHGPLDVGPSLCSTRAVLLPRSAAGACSYADVSSTPLRARGLNVPSFPLTSACHPLLLAPFLGTVIFVSPQIAGK